MGLSSACADNSGIGPILRATCSRTWARLGPLSMKRHFIAISYRRLDRDSFRRDRAPNRAAWRFPDWTAVGFAFPSPFLGSAPLGIPLPEHSRLVGLDLSLIGSLSLRGGQTTGGDSNPDCLNSAFLRRLSSGGLVAGRRLSPCPHLFASHGLSHSESRSLCQERSPFSPVTFAPDDEGKYIRTQAKSLIFSRFTIHLSTDLRNCLPDKANGGV